MSYSINYFFLTGLRFAENFLHNRSFKWLDVRTAYTLYEQERKTLRVKIKHSGRKPINEMKHRDGFILAGMIRHITVNMTTWHYIVKRAQQIHTLYIHKTLRHMQQLWGASEIVPYKGVRGTLFSLTRNLLDYR